MRNESAGRNENEMRNESEGRNENEKRIKKGMPGNPRHPGSVK